jgi:similar to stage IV sporulation protein
MLWKLNRKNTSQIEARISVADFKKLRKIAHKTRCKVEVKSKRGLPFLLNKYKKRKIFAITFLVIAILIFGLTRFVWNIEINCDEEIDEAKIMTLLEENGIKEGTLISKLDTEKAINNICLESEDISWVGIKVSGTNVIVSIEMATKKPEIINEDEACDIISDKDAVITKITVLNGTAVVNVGDTVKTR